MKPLRSLSLQSGLRGFLPATLPTVHVHLIQLDIQWENPAANRERVSRLIEGADVAAGDLILLPEMFDTGFSFNTARTADASGESRRFLAELARHTGAFIIGGVTVNEDAGPPGPAPAAGSAGARNRAIVAAPTGEVIAHYDKRRLFPLGSPSEAGSLSPGTEPAVFEWGAGAAAMRVCPLICYDLRFPELFQDGLKHGAEAFAVIANWPVDRAAHWRALLIARAIENQAFIFGVNRVGRDPKLTYGGGSVVVDPLGKIIAEADSREVVLSAEVSRSTLDDWRGRFPAWKSR